MARKRNVQRIQDEIARLQGELEAHRKAESERLGDLAVKAGLADIEIADRDLLSALKAVAAKFQGPSDNAVRAA